MKTRCQTARTRLKSLTLILTLAITLIIPCVQAAPGDLDTTFNSPNGFLLRANTFFSDVAIQPATGKILALGTNLAPDGSPESLFLARYNTDGTLDSSFGNAGIASGPPMSGSTKMAFQNGKIVVVGATQFASGATLIGRFEANGQLDMSFGQNGFIAHSQVPLSAIAIDSDGNIILTGPVSGEQFLFKVVLAKLTSTGALDMSFGSGGIVATETGLAFDVAVLSDGRILAAGTVDGNGFAVWRYNSNGTLDTPFGGGDGVGTAPLPNSAVALALAVQPDGRIVLAGGAGLNNVFPPAAGLARFDANGNLDASFSGGTVITAPPGVGAFFRDVAIQSDDAIVAFGSNSSSSGMSQTLLSRFTPSGTADASFGSGGNVITDFPGANVEPRTVAIQADGKIVIASDAFSSFSDRSGLVARYNGNGAPPPPPPPSFDICLQNDSSNAGRLIFRFNSTTGAYEFRDCSKGTMLTGTGTLSTLGCKLYLNDTGPKPSDRNVSVTVNTCTKVATVSITIKTTPQKTYGFTDNDITTGSCMCP